MESQNLNEISSSNNIQNDANQDFEDIISDSDIFSDESIDSLIENESEVSVLEGEKLPEEAVTPKVEEKSEEEVVFTDEEVDSNKESADSGEGVGIVEDIETERLVEEKIKQESEQYNNVQSEQKETASEGTESEGTSFFESEEDEPISLSQDELSNILEDVETSTEELTSKPKDEASEVEKISEISEEGEVAETEAIEEVSEVVEDLTPENLGEPVGETAEITEETGPVSEEPGIEQGEEQVSTLEETGGEQLEEISDEDIDVLGTEGEEVKEEQVSTLEEEPQKPTQVELPEQTVSAEEASSEQVEGSGESFFEEPEDESISLTGDELDNILKSSESIEESVSFEAEGKATEAEEAKTSESIGEEISEESVGLSFEEEKAEEVGEVEEVGISESEELKEGGEQKSESLQEVSVQSEKVEPTTVEQVESATVSAEEISKPEAKIGESEKEVSIDDVKKIIKYLDSLLEKLPDDVIKEFAESEYYDLYNKVLSKLGI